MVDNLIKFKDKRLIYFVILFASFIGCRDSKNHLEEWSIYEIQYKGNDLLADQKKRKVYKAIPLYIDYNSNWIILGLERKMKGKLHSYQEEDGYYFMDIEKSNDKRFDGEYIIKIDTIRSSKTSSEIRIIMESKDLYILGRKSLFKGL